MRHVRSERPDRDLTARLLPSSPAALSCCRIAYIGCMLDIPMKTNMMTYRPMLMAEQTIPATAIPMPFFCGFGPRHSLIPKAPRMIAITPHGMAIGQTQNSTKATSPSTNDVTAKPLVGVWPNCGPYTCEGGRYGAGAGAGVGAGVACRIAKIWLQLGQNAFSPGRLLT